MRDRLIELLKFAKSINSERVELQKDEYIYLLEFMENAIVTPVKVGQKLYVESVGRTKVNEWTVTHLEIVEAGIKIFGLTHYTKEPSWLCWDTDIGEFAFLTRWEAEKALERSENGK